MKAQDLQGKTREELYEIAKERDIPRKSEMNKEELIDALTKIGSSESESQSKNKQQKKDPSAPGQGGGQGDTPAPKGSNPDQYKNIPGNQS